MSNVNFNSKVLNYAKINNISEDEAKKKLEQEELIEKEQETVEPGSVGQELDQETMDALTYAGMLSMVTLTQMEEAELNGVKFIISTEPGGTYKYEEKDGMIEFSGSKAVVTIIEVSNKDAKINLTGSNMTLDCKATVAEIVNSGINCIINGSDGDDNITSTGIGAIINAGKGDDTITTSGIRTTIRGGEGDDTITSSGIKTNIFKFKH